MSDSFVIKADICYSTDSKTVETVENGYLVCENGLSAGVFKTLPEKYASLPLKDCTGKLVTPGLVDLHVHAPQYTFRGLGMDLELLDWLNTHTFPEESKYADPQYADAAYRRFAEEVKRGPNTRACVFATLHTDATIHLMDLLEEAGVNTMVGKVNMNRNSPDALCEESADASAEATLDWLQKSADRKYDHTRPIITPRFIPSCTDELMEKLHKIQAEYGLPVQSHLSENFGEISWVQELCPWSRFYGDAYDHFGMFGGEKCPTIMAHCVHSGKEETELMRKNGVFVAHCPASNANLSSGVAPIRRYLDMGINVGLGSDVAAGTHTSIFRAMADAIQMSKLRWRLLDDSLAPLTAAEAFYLGTMGGGKFFGKVGSFLPGYAFDAVVVDDSRYTPADAGSLIERLERTIYLSEDRDVAHKFVDGRELF